MLITNVRELLYSVCISGDGNFHLQSKASAKDVLQDPSFFSNSAFFVNYENYTKYTAQAQRIKEKKQVCQACFRLHHKIYQLQTNCTGKAGTSSRDRPNQGFKLTGIFAWQCRHGLYMANGVADLPKGERSFFCYITVHSLLI